MIPSSESFFEPNFLHTDIQFGELINNQCVITSTTQLVDLQQLLAQLNNSWQISNNLKERKTTLDILQTRKHTNDMQLIAYRWKNFHLINSNNINHQRKLIYEELTTVFDFDPFDKKSSILFSLLRIKIS